MPPPDLPTILAAIQTHPDDAPRWLALARWLGDDGRDDEAAAVRVFWPTLRDNLATVSLDATLADLERHKAILGEAARTVEARTRDTLPDD